jgi:hypothetical protein
MQGTMSTAMSSDRTIFLELGEATKRCGQRFLMARIHAIEIPLSASGGNYSSRLMNKDLFID